MKILDIPQSGKRGLYVSQGGRYGQISRILAIPANPRTPSQMSVRAILARVTSRWRTLEETERLAWNATASGISSRSRLGQNGPLTGAQLFSKINCTLAAVGEPPADVPPDRPSFPASPVGALTITNDGGGQLSPGRQLNRCLPFCLSGGAQTVLAPSKLRRENRTGLGVCYSCQ